MSECVTPVEVSRCFVYSNDEIYCSVTTTQPNNADIGVETRVPDLPQIRPGTYEGTSTLLKVRGTDGNDCSRVSFYLDQTKIEELKKSYTKFQDIVERAYQALKGVADDDPNSDYKTERAYELLTTPTAYVLGLVKKTGGDGLRPFITITLDIHGRLSLKSDQNLYSIVVPDSFHGDANFKQGFIRLLETAVKNHSTKEPK